MLKRANRSWFERLKPPNYLRLLTILVKSCNMSISDMSLRDTEEENVTMGPKEQPHLRPLPVKKNEP